jgi:hypothetical protein
LCLSYDYVWFYQCTVTLEYHAIRRFDDEWETPLLTFVSALRLSIRRLVLSMTVVMQYCMTNSSTIRRLDDEWKTPLSLSIADVCVSFVVLYDGVLGHFRISYRMLRNIEFRIQFQIQNKYLLFLNSTDTRTTSSVERQIFRSSCHRISSFPPPSHSIRFFVEVAVVVLLRSVAFDISIPLQNKRRYLQHRPVF